MPRNVKRDSKPSSTDFYMQGAYNNISFLHHVGDTLSLMAIPLTFKHLYFLFTLLLLYMYYA